MSEPNDLPPDCVHPIDGRLFLRVWQGVTWAEVVDERSECDCVPLGRLTADEVRQLVKMLRRANGVS